MGVLGLNNETVARCNSWGIQQENRSSKFNLPVDVVDIEKETGEDEGDRVILPAANACSWRDHDKVATLVSSSLSPSEY